MQAVSPHLKACRVNVRDNVRGVQLLVLDPAE
jgi:hypothetical protein